MTTSPKHILNSIKGKVVLKESGIGIPDLLVIIYDLDPGTRPEEELNSQQLGDNLGSILTSNDGSFLLNYDDVEYRIRNPTEKRPDLLLMVLGPEDSDSDSPPMILFKSKLLRQDSARNQSAFVRISSNDLKKAGINLPNEEKESPESKIHNYIKEKNSKFLFNEGITAYRKTVVDDLLEEKKKFIKNY